MMGSVEPDWPYLKGNVQTASNAAARLSALEPP
jgi:hypothetical protein